MDTVSGEPPPITRVERPMVVAATSCTGSARTPASVTAPDLGSMVDTEAREAPVGVIPPKTVRSPWWATMDSRETGAASCQGSMPASMESGPVGRATLASVSLWFGVGGDEGPADRDTAVTTRTRATIRTATVATRRRCRRIRRARWERGGVLWSATVGSATCWVHRGRRHGVRVSLTAAGPVAMAGVGVKGGSSVRL